MKRSLRGSVVGVSVLALASFALATVVFHESGRRIGADFDGVANIALPVRDAVQEVRFLSRQQRSTMALYRATHDPVHLRQFDDAATAIDGSISRASSLLAEGQTRYPNTKWIEPVTSELKLIREGCTRCVELGRALLKSGDPESAQELQARMQQLTTRFDRFFASMTNVTAELTAETQAARDTMLSLFLALGAIALLSGIALNGALFRLLAPIPALTEAAERVARGDPGAVVPVPSGGELKVLTTRFNEMVRAIDRDRRLRDGEVARRKLAELGQLAVAIAHEVRNPLSTIKMGLRAFHQRRELSTRDHERLRMCVAEVDRLDRTVKTLLHYARPSEIKPVETELDALIDRSLSAVEAVLSDRNITCIRKSLPRSPSAPCDQDRLEEALVNLIVNAVHATQPGGEIVLSSGWSDGCRDSVFIHVEDHGTGIDSTTLDRIFEPFFTTRSDGTGIGLPHARNIIERHGGRLEIVSARGSGTTASITLPAVVAHGA